MQSLISGKKIHHFRSTLYSQIIRQDLAKKYFPYIATILHSARNKQPADVGKNLRPFFRTLVSLIANSKLLQYAQRHSNRILWFFPFWPLTRAPKTPQKQHFVRFCSVFAAPQVAAFLRHICAKFCRKRCRKRCYKRQIFALPHKRRKISRSVVFAAHISQKNLQKYQKSVFSRLPLVGCLHYFWFFQNY